VTKVLVFYVSQQGLVYFRPICIIRDSKQMSGTNVLVPPRGHLFQFVRVYKSLMCFRTRKKQFKTL